MNKFDIEIIRERLRFHFFSEMKGKSIRYLIDEIILSEHTHFTYPPDEDVDRIDSIQKYDVSLPLKDSTISRFINIESNEPREDFLIGIRDYLIGTNLLSPNELGVHHASGILEAPSPGAIANAKSKSANTFPPSGQYVPHCHGPNFAPADILLLSQVRNRTYMLAKRVIFSPSVWLKLRTDIPQSLPTSWATTESFELVGGIYPYSDEHFVCVEHDLEFNFYRTLGFGAEDKAIFCFKSYEVEYISFGKLQKLQVQQILGKMKNIKKVLFSDKYFLNTINNRELELRLGELEIRLIEASADCDIAEVANLLYLGANPNVASSEDGRTPLHWSAVHQSHEMHGLLTGINCDLRSLLGTFLPDEILASEEIGELEQKWMDIVSKTDPLIEDRNGLRPAGSLVGVDLEANDTAAKLRGVLWDKFLKHEAIHSYAKGLDFFGNLQLPSRDLTP